MSLLQGVKGGGFLVRRADQNGDPVSLDAEIAVGKDRAEQLLIDIAYDKGGEFGDFPGFFRLFYVEKVSRK